MPLPPEPTTDRSRYPAHPRQVGIARKRAEGVAARWGADQRTVDSVASVLAELVANAVIHACAPRGHEVGVTLRLLDNYLRIEVRDADPAPLAPCAEPSEQADLQHLADNGRGLLLVDQLCDGRWGSADEVIGKTVWAEVPLRRAAENSAQEPLATEPDPDLCQWIKAP
ncbi:anti-sigma regulatory factor (Ser/Thr protein kinase) [Streptomyces sp. TLI_55]|uniref:ATP-binding protein n=1 Tax=Streptomyces sp. TLI_55 TaxID=1938861 RepID=UPI000BD45916|nr:ATP-binding protein [Streptomyces sp. TLI_55]SNX88691.1 anti-sigma regulatory factor (Ser/Thr protein kinase) [Streptomyces sp. TLI_55]